MVMTLDRNRAGSSHEGACYDHQPLDAARGQVWLIRRSSYCNDVCMTWIQCSARTHGVLQRHESLAASHEEALCPLASRHESYTWGIIDRERLLTMQSDRFINIWITHDDRSRDEEESNLRQHAASQIDLKIDPCCLAAGVESLSPD